VWAAGFAAAANDMTAGDSAAISAIASNATIFAFIRFPIRLPSSRKYKSRFLKLVQLVFERLKPIHPSISGWNGQSLGINRRLSLFEHLRSLG
jgi:hypothetical protein